MFDECETFPEPSEAVYICVTSPHRKVHRPTGETLLSMCRGPTTLKQTRKQENISGVSARRVQYQFCEYVRVCNNQCSVRTCWRERTTELSQVQVLLVDSCIMGSVEMPPGAFHIWPERRNISVRPEWVLDKQIHEGTVQKGSYCWTQIKV